MDAKTTRPHARRNPAMATRWRLTVVAMCTLLATPPVHAVISRWDSGDIIPGTEGITPGPGVQLDPLEGQTVYDLNNDNVRDKEDHRIWIQDLKHACYGDANS
jgi:hypothetical protein